MFVSNFQRELDRFKEEHNSHRIRKSKNSISPGGRPITMYRVPEEYGKKNCLTEILDHTDIEMIEGQCIFEKLPCEENLYYVCESIVEEKQLKRPVNTSDATCLYLYLRGKIYEYVERLETAA